MTQSRPGKVELLLVGLAVLLAGGLRFYRITEIGLSHYDAGVYAQSALWPYTGQFHFALGYFSPPLYPTLWGLFNLLTGGPTDWGGPFLSAMAGTGLVVAGWWMGRSWFSSWAGVAAAFWLATDPVLVMFSRIGLTDMTFTLLFLLGLLFCRSAIEKGGLFRVLLAGLIVGLAWLTKYNGMLVLPLSLGWILHSSWKTRTLRFSCLSLVSLLAYAPWAAWFHVQHGYETLIAHQRGYFQGIEAWPNNLDEFIWDWRQVAVPWSAGLAFVLIGMLAFTRKRWWGGVFAVALGGYLVAMNRPEFVFVALYLTAAIGVFRAREASEVLVLSLLLILLLILPGMYTPYLRLFCPLLAILPILAAGGIVGMKKAGELVDRPTLLFPQMAVGLTFACMFLVLTQLTWEFRRFSVDSTWAKVLAPAPGYRNIVNDLGLCDREFEVVATFCRWPANYYLALDGLPVRPQAELPVAFQLSENDVLVCDLATIESTSGARESLNLLLARSLPGKRSGLLLDVPTNLDDLSRDLYTPREVIFTRFPVDK